MPLFFANLSGISSTRTGRKLRMTLLERRARFWRRCPRSRRALFLGKLDPSKSGTEQGEISGNDFLFQASGSQVRPKLFLKGDLQEQGERGLATEVRIALAAKKRRV